METTRRNIFRFVAGASAGVAFTPAPWKLLDDVSIWSQNWGWLPRPLRGEITETRTACTLCPTGCAVTARCVAGQPYRLTGTDRPLCPAGIGAHQLPYAAARIRAASLHGDTISLEKAAAVLRERLSAASSIAVLDGRPTRTASDIYRQIAAANPKWHHVTTAPVPAHAIDPAKAQLILSFGAPVLHGWQMPIGFLKSRSNYKLIQIESSQSRTAAFADTWLPIRPRTEGIMAAAIAHVILRDAGKPAPNRPLAGIAAGFPPARAEQLTGIPAAQIEQTARAFAAAPSALALAPTTAGALTPEATALIQTLNHLIGDRAAITALPSRPAPPALDDLPDHSLDVLFIDAADALPPAIIRRKLRQNATVVALAAFPGEWTAMADLVIPTPAFLEFREDVPEPLDAPRPSFRLASAILPPAPDTIPAADFVAKLAGLHLTVEQAIDTRIAAIHSAAKGTVKDQPLSAVTLENFKTALAEGAAWQGDPAPGRPAPPSLPADPEAFAKALIPEPASGPTLAVGAPLPPVPLLGKLWQESSLYPAAGVVRLNPAAGFTDGQQVQLTTAFGTGRAAVKLDPAIPNGILQTDTDAALKLCGGQGAAWRIATVTLTSSTERSAS